MTSDAATTRLPLAIFRFVFAFIVDFSRRGSTDVRLLPGRGNAAELDLEEKKNEFEVKIVRDHFYTGHLVT